MGGLKAYYRPECSICKKRENVDLKNDGYYCRDSWVINRHSKLRLLPFELKFRLPKLRKERIISDRDMLGRIVLSKVPRRRLFT